MLKNMVTPYNPRPSTDQEILQSIHQVSYQIGVCNETMVAATNQISKKIDLAKRKERRKYVNGEIAILSDGRVYYVEYYDDGSEKLEKLSDDIRGRWITYRIDYKYRKSDADRFFLIAFSDCNKMIVGKKSDGKHKLYENFVRAGIRFNKAISLEKISRVLYERFGYEIEMTDNVYSVVDLAGWDGNRFFYAENSAWLGKKGLPDLPVLHKHFIWHQDANALNLYFEFIQRIVAPELRAVFMIFPMAGLIATILRERGLSISIALNFIPINGEVGWLIPYFLQIFNRTQLGWNSLDKSDKAVREMLSTSKDEVLIFDVRTTSGASQYTKQKLQRMREMILSKMQTGELDQFGNVYPANAIAFIGSELICGRNVKNIFLEGNVIVPDETNAYSWPPHILSAVFTAYADFVGKNMQMIQNIIFETEIYGAGSKRLGITMAKILDAFWKNMGIDFIDKADISGVNFGELFSDEWDGIEDWAEILVHVVRKGIGNYYAKERKRSLACDVNSIYYDESYVWIYPEILREMLERNGLLGKKNLLLQRAREVGLLKAENGELSRKIQIGGRRMEAYQFLRENLNIHGQVEIIDLAKEEQDD